MKITYDPSANAAYTRFIDSIAPGESKRQCPCECPDDQGLTILDFDVFGRLLGMEILEADRLMHPETLTVAERL